jgi:hypothetical protein
MQMQKATGTKKSTKNRCLGDTVSWTSHANGNITSKIGRIVAIMRPGVNYVGFGSLANSFYENILMEQGYTRDQAREKIRQTKSLTSWAKLIKKVYNLKFNPLEGMRRDTYHYLVEVNGDGGKPYLYHPNI